MSTKAGQLHFGYSGAIIVEFLNRRTAINPRIKQSEEDAIDVGLEFVVEEEAAESVRLEVCRLQEHVEEMRRRRESVKSMIVSERERKQRLEMILFRKRLKGRQSLAMA
jgi:prefoldin subunit 5